MKGQDSKSDYDFLAVKKDDPFYADDARRNLFNFFDKGHAQTNARLASLQPIIIVHGDVHDRDFFRRGSQKYDRTYWCFGFASAIECKQRLRLMISDTNG